MGIQDREQFATTRWSLVQAASQEQSLSDDDQRAALSELCENYWFPVYAHCRRKGSTPDDAEDQTQEFFARILDGNLIQSADPNRGRFRSYLLTSLDHFLINEYKKSQAIKRGGGARHVSIDVSLAESRIGAQGGGHAATPEQEFERQWALVMLGSVYKSLQDEQTDEQRRKLFSELREYLSGSNQVPYSVVAEKLRMSEGAVKVAIHRLRKRFGQLLRREITQTVASVDEIDDEIRRLQTALSRR